jgi:hypothetical protein
MAFVNKEVRRNICVITEDEKTAIKDWMRTKVDLWIEKHGNDEFIVRNLLMLTKVDLDWIGTPLRVLTDYYLRFYTVTAARKEAGRALGWLVKSMLNEDVCIFDTSHERRVRSYWLVV